MIFPSYQKILVIMSGAILECTLTEYHYKQVLKPFLEVY